MLFADFSACHFSAKMILLFMILLYGLRLFSAMPAGTRALY
jgi:hypothetical protein